MSVIPLKADIHQRGLHVRLVPRPDIQTNRPMGRFRLKALRQGRRYHPQVFMRAALPNLRD